MGAIGAVLQTPGRNEQVAYGIPLPAPIPYAYRRGKRGGGFVLVEAPPRTPPPIALPMQGDGDGMVRAAPETVERVAPELVSPSLVDLVDGLEQGTRVPLTACIEGRPIKLSGRGSFGWDGRARRSRGPGHAAPMAAGARSINSTWSTKGSPVIWPTNAGLLSLTA